MWRDKIKEIMMRYGLTEELARVLERGTLTSEDLLMNESPQYLVHQ